MEFPKLHIILLILFQDVISMDIDNSTSYRKERVNGRIVKLYSGHRPDPILCQKEGFQPDHNDCSIFYRCLKSSSARFTVFRFQCPPGTIFDPDKEVCNYPQNTKRSNCVPHSSDIDQRNDNEIEDIQHEVPKPIVQKDNDNDLSMFKPVPLGIYAEDQPPPQQFTTSKHQYSTTPSFVNNNDDIFNSISNIQPYHEERCVAEGFMGDSKDCKKFYRCVSNLKGGFIRYEFMCNDATVWDDSTQGCNHAWLARNLRCGREATYYDSNYESVYGHKNTISNNIPLKEKNDTSYGQDFEPTHKPFNKPHVFQTSTYKTFYSTEVSNPTDSHIQTLYGDKISESFISNHVTTTHNNLQSDRDKTENLNANKNICNQNGFFGYVNDCSKFYRCVESSRGKYIKYDFTCSDGTVWDNKLKACNFAWAVKECGSSGAESLFQTTEAYHSFSTSSTGFPYTVHDDIDAGYGIHQEVKEEPPKASTFSTTSSEYTIPQAINYNGCAASGFYGDESDCQNFYRCIETRRGVFIKYAYKCGEGTLWDPSIEACNHAWAVKSCKGPVHIGHNTTNILDDTTIRTTISLIQSTSTEPNEILNQEQNTGYGNIPNQIFISIPEDTNYGLKPKICRKAGFVGDSNDCKKFYRCVDVGNNKFQTYEFYCGEGTVWDQKIESCNHQWAVEKCGIKGTYNDIHEMELVNSTETYYVTEKETTKLESSTKVPTFQSTTSNPFTTHSITSTFNSDSYITSNRPTMFQVQCSSEGFYPDPQDCRKFFRCIDIGGGKFTKYDFTCGEGSAWDVNINSCNHFEYVKSCSNYQVTETNNMSNETLIKTTQTQENALTSSSTITPTSTETKPSFQNICNQDGYFGNRNDCTKFYRCVDNGKSGFDMYEYSCGEGTIWDQEILACNHPRDVKSSSCSMENNTGTTTSKASSMTTQFTTVSEDVNIAQSTTEQIRDSTTLRIPADDFESNSNRCSQEGFFPDSSNCKNFYRCVSNGKNGYEKYEFTCGEGTLWDQEIKACNHPRDIKNPDCTNQSVNNTTTTTSTTENLVLTTSTTSQRPSSTMDTWSTESTITASTNKISPDDESTTSSTTTKPTTTVASRPETKPHNENNCSGEGYVGNTNDCKRFYRCVSNEKGGFTKYDFACGEGTIWDQAILACNHPQDVQNPSCSLDNGNESGTTEKEISTISKETSSSMTTTSTTEASHITSESTENQQPHKEDNGNFTCSKAGFYPNPNDCKKFYRCVDWNNDGSSFSIFHFECGEGTIWDPSLDTCNYEDSVYPSRNCSNSSKPSSTTDNITEGSEQTTLSTTNTPSTEITSTVITSTQGASETTPTESTTNESTTTKMTTTQSSTTQSTTTQSTTTTTEQQVSTTDSSTTDQSSTSISSTSDATTTDRSTTSMDQTTQTTKVTDELSSEATTQSSTTEQQSTSIDSSTESTESDKTTTEASQQTTDNSTTTPSKDKCPEMEDNQYAYVCPTSFRRHPKYCNIFYQCTEDDESHDLKIALFHCPNNTIYDETKTQCVDENKSTKACDGTVAQTHRIKRFSNDYVEPLTVDTKSYACETVGYFPFERNKECSQALLKCQRSKNNKIQGYVFRCPDGYTFWSRSKRCERISKIKECKQSAYPWNRKYEIPKEIRNVAY